MKKLLTALAIFTFSLCSFAQNIYAGIWLSSSGRYLNIAQNNNAIILTAFSNYPASGIVMQLNNGQHFAPPTLDIGDIGQGTITNGTGLLTTIGVFQACITVNQITFTSPATMVFKMVSISNTQLGASQGISCSGLYASMGAVPGVTATATKVF